MDIPVVAIALISAVLLSPRRAMPIAIIGWAIGLSMVAWGPAHNSSVHLDSAGFWVPWSILLAICAGIVFGIDALQRRRAAKRTVSRA